jgi:hypothetical protein
LAFEDHVDGRPHAADQAAHLGNGAGQHVDLERSAAREATSTPAP